ncbi:Zinc finger, ZZ type [Aphelenchoides besseyi]|nr:Zinc finger, ZZ type [Aphelenchoides besseyi]KAI6195274.1 Zinc finger, ZZ type [Aphelenchoides besseyi]
MDSFMELPPLPRPNTPDSPNSSSDKENKTSRLNGPSKTQRVCDIVREFDNIIVEQTNLYQNANQPKNFDRYGFWNASLQVKPATYLSPTKQEARPQTNHSEHSNQQVRYDCVSTNSFESSSDSHSTPISSVPSSRFLPPPDPLMNINDLLPKLRKFNQIRYSAYRTGMKCFAIQKQLRLDLIELSDLDRQFRLLPPGIHRLPWESLFTILRHCFENAHLKFPRSVSDVQTAIQSCTDFLRQLSPGLEIRLVQCTLVVLCSAQVEDKYRYLYRIYTPADDGRATSENLQLLFTDLAKLPILIEEERAFGGHTVEPSVRALIRNSYTSVTAFLSTNPPSTLTEIQFIDWIKQDPQTLVWLRVMNRLMASEFAKHNASCAACKANPIVGIRFRCLNCFNVDLCQTCFFLQRQVRGHKITHEFHEYYIPTNTLDNVRDFTQIIHNKMRRSKSSNKVGYAPVDLNGTLPPIGNQQTSRETAAIKAPTSNGLATRMLQRNGEIDIDELIDQARRDGRLPSTPTNSTSNGHLTSNNEPQTTVEELSDLIRNLKDENRQLTYAYYQQVILRNKSGVITSPNAFPPALLQHESDRRFNEAMDCMRSVSSSDERNTQI